MIDYCNCELPNRRWNPSTGQCESCGSLFLDRDEDNIKRLAQQYIKKASRRELVA